MSYALCQDAYIHQLDNADETAEKDSFLAGVIASSDPGSWTSSEDPIKRFKVVDGHGRAIPCVALGEIANDQSLGHGRHGGNHYGGVSGVCTILAFRYFMMASSGCLIFAAGVD